MATPRDPPGQPPNAAPSTRPPLPVERLRFVCRPEEHACLGEATRCTDETVGQRQALEALRVGLSVVAPGYNVFVTGMAGSGRTFTIHNFLKSLSAPSRLAEDRVFVNNFEDSTRPRLLRLPRALARKFKSTTEETVSSLRKQIPRALEEESFVAQRDRITKGYETRERELIQGLLDRLKVGGLALISMQTGPHVVQGLAPIVDEKPVPFEALRKDESTRSAFTAELVRKLQERQEQLPPEGEAREAFIESEIKNLEERAEQERKSLEESIKESRELFKSLHRELVDLEQAAVRKVIELNITELKTAFPYPDVTAHLDRVVEHMVKNRLVFRPHDEESQERSSSSATLETPHGELSVYDVNVIQEAPELSAPPIVIERHPTFSNLFGVIERYPDRHGAMVTDFTRIRGGSLLESDGGYLIMYARDVLLEPGVWRNLVRTLKSGQVEIQNADAALFLLPFALKPEPIPVDVKVILIGDELLFHLLSHYEEDFPKVFKVKAEFDTTIDRTPEGIARFAEVARGMQHQEKNIPPLTAGAMAVLLEQALRMSGRQNRISTRFGEIGDLIREASHWARAGAPEGTDAPPASIEAEHIRRAIAGKLARHQLLDRRLNREILEDYLLVDSTGSRVGQINGLAVYGSGRHYFGKPARITASVGVGRGGLVSIEREARLSGPVHDKAILILSGYLRHRYGRRVALALTASIAFEQSYGGIEGDSASLAELYALLSAISFLPIRQNVAITGSMNQHGDAQAIGGVNEKIEGFFDLCSGRGLTGDQGCVIPSVNEKDLMLKDEIIEAARAGKFHVWPISNVDDGIPLLFGVAADSLHRRVEEELAALTKAASPEPDVRHVDDRKPFERETPSPPDDPRPPTPTRDDDSSGV